jgi:hypothetical protein
MTVSIADYLNNKVIPGQKVIGGKTFRLSNGWKKKEPATDLATKLRRKGWNARVIRVGNIYCVYQSQYGKGPAGKH